MLKQKKDKEAALFFVILPIKRSQNGERKRTMGTVGANLY